MDSLHEDRERAAGTRDDEDPASGRKPVYYRPNRQRGYMELNEPGARSVAWPLDTFEYGEFDARRNLEQVGLILKRLELDQADIVRLRTETRAILAGLAA